jgi:isocitrate dehydrogenase
MLSSTRRCPRLFAQAAKVGGPDGQEADTNCVIPDNSYAPVYDESIKFFKQNGKLNPATAGTVQNVGLMAQKAEEYGSHPTTFEIPQAGTVKMILADGTVLHEHTVEAGDIWRSASTKKAPIEDWVNLAISRQKAENCNAIFWLDANPRS